MPLTMRPYSVNTYVLSKVWFKCSSVNLRVQDITSINSNIKSWLYQDCFEKPGELVLHRHAEDGGLGLFHVKMRALALLIRSFMETAANPNFRQSLFHQLLYRYHVLGEDHLPDPGLPPYYDQDFFATIRHYHQHSPLNVALMSIKQWYQALLEDRVLMSAPADGSPPSLLPVRVETLSPTTDWPQAWQLVRTRGLGSDLVTFLFKLLHCLLPTQDRVARLGGSENGGRCKLCNDEIEDILHAMFNCPHNLVSGNALLGYLQVATPGLTQEGALKLELEASLNDDGVLASLCVLSTSLKFIWEIES